MADEKKKRNLSAEERLQQAQDNIVDATKAANDILQQGNQQMVTDAQADNTANEARLAEINAASERDFADMMQQQRDEMEAEKKEAETEEKNDLAAQRFTGVTEMATALSNLIAVGAGASNQVYHSYSNDWMQKADKNKKARKVRMDAMKDRMRGMQAQLSALKQSNALKGLQLQAQNQKDMRALNAKGYELKAAGLSDVAAAEAAAATTGYKIGQDRDKAARLRSQTKLAIPVSDGNGGYTGYNIPVNAMGGIVLESGTPAEKDAWNNARTDDEKIAVAQRIAASNEVVRKKMEAAGKAVTTTSTASSGLGAYE